MIACGFVLIHAGEPIAQQGALNVVGRGGIAMIHPHGGQGVIDRAIEAER